MASSVAFRFLLKYTEMMESVVAKCTTRDIPSVFRHLFGKDIQFRSGLAAKLVELYGTYQELSFDKLIRPPRASTPLDVVEPTSFSRCLFSSCFFFFSSFLF